VKKPPEFEVSSQPGFFLPQLLNFNQIPGSKIVVVTRDNPISEMGFVLVGVSVFGGVGQEFRRSRSD